MMGTGTLTLSGPNTYTGGTTVSGGKLAVEGAVAGNATVQFGAEIGGHGSIDGIIRGAGSVGPGDSAGILTAGATNPTGNIVYNFEFTQAGAPNWSFTSASGNDVLHLTGTTPFTAPLTLANQIKLYFASDGLTCEGGLFTNGSIDNLTANLANSLFYYYLLDNQNGTTLYNGNRYDRITGVTMRTVPIAGANFRDGTVNGCTEQFNVGTGRGKRGLDMVLTPGMWTLILGVLSLMVFLRLRTRCTLI